MVVNGWELLTHDRITPRVWARTAFTHSLWTRQHNNRPIYVVLPSFKSPEADMGGASSVKTALCFAGVLRIAEWADPDEVF